MAEADKEKQQDYLIGENQQRIGEITTHLFGIGGEPGALARLESGINKILKNQEESKAEHRADTDDLITRTKKNSDDIAGIIGPRCKAIEDRVTFLEARSKNKKTWWGGVFTKIFIAIAILSITGAFTWMFRSLITAIKVLGV